LGSFAFATLVAVVLGACYDMPLIPDDSLAIAGSAGRGSAGSGSGGRPGIGGAVESSGATHTDGGSKPNGASGSSAGGAGKSTGTGGTMGQAGASGAPQVIWFELDESTAPASSTTNSELGIDGAFYAYGDGCSQLTWDDQGRCASGKLCAPELSPDNWGIAIGFDFRNTGAKGMPPDTKLTWNPDDFAARGLAWRIRGNAPKFQVWVLNMASSWQGQCSVMNCEIAGPPDGVALAALNGQLHFDNMIKDTWGSGIDYEFDPAAVHALQFKIAAVKVGATSFDFCIDALGIVR
jgi:hypothetical protein